MYTKRYKYALLILLWFIPRLAFADTVDFVRIDKDDHPILKAFTFIDSPDLNIDPLQQNTLVAVKTTHDEENQYVRYQQYYRGIIVYGYSIVEHKPKNKKSSGKRVFTGKLATGLSLMLAPYYRSDTYRNRIIKTATEDYKQRKSSQAVKIFKTDIQPAIWIDSKKQPAFVYIIDFKADSGSIRDEWPHYIIDTANKNILHRWNNIQSVNANGPGGNQKTGQYRYGQTGLPALPVTQLNNTCYLRNDKVLVATLNNTWTLANPSDPVAVNHPCDNNNGDPGNGAWSPANDAFLFGNVIVDMYRDWYGQSILINADGTPKRLTMLVHAGTNYENAFWNGNYMIFGDGYLSYHPLVSLGVAAHELGHAFTSLRSNLLYFNQSGAINEAFSDMSAITAEYYFLQNHPQGYQTIYGKQLLDWLIGDRIAKGNYALRSMSQPNLFGSADCEESGNGCNRTWADIVRLADQVPQDQRQSYIVHRGSGVFNRAFYEMVRQFNGDVKKVFKLMIRANMTRWTETSDFADAACGVIQVARDLNYDLDKVKNAFSAVQITPACQ